MDDDTWTDDMELIGNKAVEFFQNLLTSEAHSINEDLVGAIPSIISEEDNYDLTRFPSEEEVKEAVWSLSPDSAPGPDGFSGYFLTSCWDIIKGDVVAAVTGFFSGHPIPRAINSSLIVLIPKNEDPNFLIIGLLVFVISCIKFIRRF